MLWRETLSKVKGRSHRNLHPTGAGCELVGDVGELGLIERIRVAFGVEDGEIARGIGDDAAAIRSAEGRLTLVTTDMLVEKVHFDHAYTGPYELGGKAVAVNISDIAAMGGTPRLFLLSMGLPRAARLDFVDRFYTGASDTAARFGVRLIGGDTVESRGGMVLNVVVLGEVPEDEVVYRGGAKAGDRIFVTGTIGDSATGLELLRCGVTSGNCVDEERELLMKHLSPVPRVTEARRIAAERLATSMIDISDGLVGDLKHICDESGVRGIIRLDRVPISGSCRATAENLGLGIDRLLTGGEDYELLFTVPPDRIRDLHEVGRELSCTLTEIGEIRLGEGVEVRDIDGEPIDLGSSGYEHFGDRRP